MTINAKNYTSRVELEKYIESLDTKTHEIKGTKNDLERLQLSEETKIFGVKCITTDSTPKQIFTEKPNRGEIGNKNNLQEDKK